MKVSRCGRHRRMKIGMGIKPQQEQRTAHLVCMHGNPGDAAQSQRMIATQDDRHALCNRLAGGGLQRLRPGQCLGQGMDNRVFRSDIGKRTGGKIAAVFHCVPKLAQRLHQPRHPVSGRPHKTTRALLPGINRGTDQDAMGHLPVSFITCGCARP